MRVSDRDTGVHLRPGALVEVRSEAEIHATLDANGMLDGMPILPEMRRFYGHVFRVYKRADKTCVDGYGLQRMRDTVFLENVRCDGSGHDGCDRMCALFWKEAWLRPARPSAAPTELSLRDLVSEGPASVEIDPEKRYVCQSTALPDATQPLPWWEFSQYVRDLRDGQVGYREFARIIRILVSNKIRRALGLRDYNSMRGKSKRTPQTSLGVKPGDVVCLKSREEICETLDASGKTKGMEFTAEMARFCGGKFTVLKRANRMIVEGTGKMIPLRDSVVLDGFYCDGGSHRGCKREHLFFCKEAWIQPPCGTCAGKL